MVFKMIKNYSLLSYGRTYNPVDWYYNPSYVVNRIYYIIKGTAFYKNNIPLKPKHLYIFRAMADFSVHQDENDPVDHVFFDFQTYKKLSENDYIEIELKDNPILESFIKIIATDFTKNDIPPEIAKNYFELILYYIQDYLAPDNSYSEVTTTALAILHNSPIVDLSVNYLSKKMNRNINHIIRCFKKDIGITPHAYISNLKINTAISYISQGYSCTDIAELLGFGSIAAFSYFFKKKTGMNFSDYKSNNTDYKKIDYNYYPISRK
ncbi:MAG: helix-turn-helix domain-containing protein [Lachnospiraceae bacterium]|nr:helix-turn-helix domain-containing protein [Lachnospiraceae bacterium]